MAHGWWMRMTYLADVFHYAFWQWDVNQMQPDASVQQSAGKATGNVCEMVPLHCDMASVLRDRGCGWNHGASLPPCLVCDTVQVYDVSMTWLKASQCCLVCIHYPMPLTTCFSMMLYTCSVWTLPSPLFSNILFVFSYRRLLLGICSYYKPDSCRVYFSEHIRLLVYFLTCRRLEFFSQAFFKQQNFLA